MHEAVDVMRKVRFKAENNNDKRSTQKLNKNWGGEQDKSNETSFQKRKNMKKFYCCGSGTHMLNNFEIKDTIEKDQCFYRTLNLHSNHQQASDKGDEQTV